MTFDEALNVLYYCRNEENRFDYAFATIKKEIRRLRRETVPVWNVIGIYFKRKDDKGTLFFALTACGTIIDGLLKSDTAEFTESKTMQEAIDWARNEGLI